MIISEDLRRDREILMSAVNNIELALEFYIRGSKERKGDSYSCSKVEWGGASVSINVYSERQVDRDGCSKS